VKAAQVDPGTITHQRLAFPEGGVDSAAHCSARALKIILKVARKTTRIRAHHDYFRNILYNGKAKSQRV
jgi:hypothetical protein